MQVTLPPGPQEIKIKQLIKFIKQPIAFMKQCREQYGTIFTLRFPNQPPHVVITKPQDIKNVFTASNQQLHTGEINSSILQPVLGDSSLLNLDGSKHLHHRKLILPSFHGERIIHYGNVMQNITESYIRSHWSPNQWIVLSHAIREITFNIILRTIFGLEENTEIFHQLSESLRKFLYIIKTPYGFLTLLNKSLQINLGPLTPWAQMKKLKHQIEGLLLREIVRRRKRNALDCGDVLSLLLQSRDENNQIMSDQEVVDELMTLLIAGHETTATGVTWALYHILTSNSVYDQLMHELKFSSQINQIQYLDALVKESLRITPVVPYIVRLTKEKYQLCQYLLPKGIVIVPSIYLAHHEKSEWIQPDKFMPERFLNSTEKPYTFLPFGGGQRRCIGASYAQYEMKILIATILSVSQLQLKNNYNPKLIRKGVVMTPSKGVPVFVKKLM